MCTVGLSAMGDRIAEVSETYYEGDYSNPPSPTENLSSASEELVISRPRQPCNANTVIN